MGAKQSQIHTVPYSAPSLANVRTFVLKPFHVPSPLGAVLLSLPRKLAVAAAGVWQKGKCPFAGAA
eukprot:scaffold104097_cov15-Tisochrysis_lutea.AAC.1